MQVDSENKHGILLEVVQVLTDLNFIITKAYISSDGGWFMDGKILFRIFKIASMTRNTCPFFSLSFLYGDLTKYGIRGPIEGPFYMKRMYGKYPLINLGTCKKIKSGEIQVKSFE